jgi:hypothetical protein
MEAFPVGQSVVKFFTVCMAASLFLGFSGCKKPVASEEPAEEAPPASSAPAATPSPTTTPAVAATTVAPVPTAAPELAPPGVFYLLAAARVETSDGVTGLPPGTGVKLVRPGVYLTPAGEVSLNPSLLTNDMGVARRALAQEKAKQSTLEQQRLAAEKAAASASQVADAQTAGNHPQLPPQAAQQGPSPADTARQEIIRQIQQSEAELQQVSAQLGPFVTRFGSPDAAAKKSPQAFQLVQQLNSLQSEIQSLQAKMSQIQ